MFKGFTVAVVALISTAQLDRYLTNGGTPTRLDNSFGAEARDGHLMG
ncbi:hypothetical protein [Bradyrhizobium zhanjiangense]|nr:hypothetical protein [Bradyrhizobium zhanjiangense]